MMALVAMLLLFFFGGGLVAYQFFYSPMKTADNRAVLLQGEINDDNLKLLELEQSMPRLDLDKKISLPADVVNAKRLYSEALDKMLRDSEFPAGSIFITPKDAERVATTTGSKKPAFQRLVYDVKASGELASFVTFLDKFYGMPLLHRIRTLKIDRPITVTNPQFQGQNFLEYALTIEALIVDGAQDRKTLLPEGVKLPPRNARTTSQYASIAGKDIFYGPPPPAAPTSFGGDREAKAEVELEDCIHLDEITLGDRKGPVASLYDVLDNKRYIIRSDGFGGFDVGTYYYIKEVRKPLEFGKDLVIKNDKDEVVTEYKIIRIDATQLVLQSEDTYYTLQVGRTIRQVKELKPADAKAMGLAVKEKKKEDKKDDAKEKKDVPKTDAKDKKDSPADKKAPAVKEDKKDTKTVPVVEDEDF
jgi:hypothetical protein